MDGSLREGLAPGGEADAVLALLRRYDKPGPRYTSYPTAVEFAETFDEAEYRRRLAAVDGAAADPLSFYVHLPFCDERCTYCGCNVVITKKHEVAGAYLDYLFREVDMLARALPRRRRLSQVHWGGGTPTYLSPAQIERLHRHIVDRFPPAEDAEVAIEVDPRVTSFEQVELLKSLGFNRISMGVQDFDPAVQAAVNRNQTEDETRALYDRCRELGFTSINFDLIYGLPKQNPESFRRTMASVVDLRPDRVAAYSYAFVPWLKAHQKRIESGELPPPETKLRLFCIAREMMLDAGYEPIGMDHFALPEDELARAVRSRRLHRNFMGYTVRMGSDMVGVGVSAIGDVRGSFAQNHKTLAGYYRALDAERFPIERGYVLDDDDRLRREVITRVMCNFHLDVADVERQFGIVFSDYFAPELAELAAPDGPVAHGFVRLGAEEIDVVGRGRLFVRNVCMVFDRHLRAKQPGERVFSRTV